MRIHRVRLRNYRGITNTYVEFPTEGVTIIEGANEIGKTCIPQAIDLIFEKLDSSRAKVVMDAKPVHRSEVPEVEIEVSTGTYRFTYRKRWLRQPETVLAITAPYVERIDGCLAHERVRAILEETLDPHLWRALRIEQWAGTIRQTESFLPSLNIRSLVDALDVAAGGDVASDSEDSLWRRICAEREKHWTPTGRVKSERIALRNGVEESQKNLADLQRRLEEIERDAARVAHLRSDRARLEVLRAECDQNERDLDERRAEAERLRSRVERLDSVHRERMAQRDRIITEQHRRGDLVNARDSRNAELAALEAEGRRIAPVMEAAVADATEARVALEEAAAALKDAETGYHAARGDHEHHRSLIDLEQLGERWQRTMAAQGRLRDAEAYLESARVDDDLLSRIENAHLAVVRAEAAVQSAGARLEGRALSDIIMRIDSEEATFAAGEEIRKIVAQELELLVPGVAEVRIKIGTESRNLVTELNRARQEFHNLCASGGVSDLVGARRAATEREEAKRNQRESISAMKNDLRDLTPRVMQEKIEGIRRRVEHYAAERPSDPPLPYTYEEAKRIAAEKNRLFDECRAGYEMRQTDARSAERRLKDEEIRKAILEDRIQNAQSALGEAERLLRSAREERSDSDLAEDLQSAQDRVRDALASLERAREDLSAVDPGSVEILLNNARAANRRAVEDLRRNEEEERDLSAGLRLRGEAGLHTRIGEVERRLRRDQRDYERLEARANAAQLLWSRFAERRLESRQRYHAPLTERIAELGRIVFGPGFKVELSEDLEVARRTLEGVTLDVEQLSAGAREQLGLLSRLACALIVSPNGGGAPVIIDDALGWSDPDRLKRMSATIAVAGKQCQIVILTCTPGRYAHIGDAKVITLPNQ
ncbi:MAG: AAA family ATPase [bacterium]|nr:AAA family ATPase [bacterium]